MASVSHNEKSTLLADDGSNHLLLVVAVTIRDNLHTLFALSLVFLGVALPWVVLATLTSWALAWPMLVLTTAPIWTTIVACADRLLAGEAVSWRVMVSDCRRHGWRGVVNGILPAICGAVILALVSGSFEFPGAGIALLTLSGVGIAWLVLAIPATPLAVRHTLAGLMLWETSAAVVLRRPMQVVGTVVVAVMGLWLAMVFGPAVLLGTAPFGLLVAAIMQPDPEVPCEQGGFIVGHPVPRVDRSRTGRGAQ